MMISRDGVFGVSQLNWIPGMGVLGVNREYWAPVMGFYGELTKLSFRGGVFQLSPGCLVSIQGA